MMQMVMLDAAYTAARYPPCASNAQCAQKSYCSLEKGLVSGRCIACGDSDHGVSSIEDFNLTEYCRSTDIASGAGKETCTACVGPDGVAFALDSHAVVQGHVDAMHRGAWVSLAVAGCLVGASL